MSFTGLLDWVRTRGTSHETYAVDPAVRAHSYGAGLPVEKVAKLVKPTTYFPYATTKAYRERLISTAKNCEKKRGRYINKNTLTYFGPNAHHLLIDTYKIN